MEDIEEQSVIVSKDARCTFIRTPQLYREDGAVHAAVLTLGVVVFGAIVQSEFDLVSFIPAPFKAHPGLTFWTVYLSAYAVFIFLCLIGVGAYSLWRLGDLGRRGSYVGLAFYSVAASVTQEETVFSQQWWWRKRSKRYRTSSIAKVSHKGNDLIIVERSGAGHTHMLSLYPPTVKKLSKEINAALRDFQKDTSA